MNTDEIFRLGWLQSLRSAKAGISLVAEMLGEYSLKGLCEEDTRAVFVEPVLRGLGWDTLDIRQVGRESRRAHQLGDMQLLYESKVAVVIEIKSLDHELRQREIAQLEKDVRQRLIGAGGMSNSERWNQEHRFECDGRVFVYGVLTNGARWLVYDFTTECTRDNNTPLDTKALLKSDCNLRGSDDFRVREGLGILDRQTFTGTCGRWKTGYPSSVPS